MQTTKYGMTFTHHCYISTLIMSTFGWRVKIQVRAKKLLFLYSQEDASLSVWWSHFLLMVPLQGWFVPAIFPHRQNNRSIQHNCSHLWGKSFSEWSVLHLEDGKEVHQISNFVFCKPLKSTEIKLNNILPIDPKILFFFTLIIWSMDVQQVKQHSINNLS